MYRYASASATIFSFFLLALALVSGCSSLGNETRDGKHAGFANVPLHRSDSTKYYKYNIWLPEIIRTNSTLRDTLTNLADVRQKEFLSGADRDCYTCTWELQLHVAIADSTEQFISLLGEGYTFTGGAHGMPFFITLNYVPANHHFVSLSDLFTDSTALRPIAKYIRRNLAQKLMAFRGTPVQGNASVDQFLREQGNWLKEGTTPSFSSYQNFLLQPQGITFIFGAYQVGPYAIGTPEIKVPVSVFRDQLSPTGLWLFALK